MPALTIRLDLPTFEHGFVYGGDKAKRAKLKASCRKLAAEGGMDLQSLAWRVITDASAYLTKGRPEARQGALNFLTAWVLDLPSGHPTHPGTIDEYLNGYDFVVTLTKVAERGKEAQIDCRVEATFDKSIGTA